MTLVEGRFRSRPNRFLVLAEVEGQVAPCHLPNPGRLRELLVDGAAVLLEPRSAGSRKTPYDLVAARKDGVLVSLDTRLPNRTVASLLRAGTLPGLGTWYQVRPEVPLGRSRVDFLLRGDAGSYYLEVKSVTLVEGGTALFPDAPTERGRRHLEELASALAPRVRAGVLFLVQRPDAHRFRPHEARDPAFARALRAVHAAGVEVHAVRSRFDGRSLVDLAPIQTSLSPP